MSFCLTYWLDFKNIDHKTIRIWKFRRQGSIIVSLQEKTFVVIRPECSWSTDTLNVRCVANSEKHWLFIDPSQIVRIHFLITGIARSICIWNVRYKVQVFTSLLRIYICLSCLTSLQTRAMWLLCLVLHHPNLETRAWDIFKLHYLYFLSLKTTALSNSVWPDMEGSVFSKRCMEFA